MRVKFFVIIFLCLFAVAQAGSGVRYGISPSPGIVPHGFITRSFHSIGFSNIINSQAMDIASANPASLTGFRYETFGLRSEYSTQIKSAHYNIDFKSLNPVIPKSVSFVVPRDDFWIGAAYQQKYSSNLEAEYLVTSMQDPGGSLGGKDHIYLETAVHSFSFLSAYKFSEWFGGEGSFSIGAQLTYNYLLNDDDYFTADIHRSGSSLSFKIGAILGVDKNFSLGLLYESGYEIEGDAKYTVLYSSATPNNIGANSDQNVFVNEIVFSTKMPGQLTIGFLIHLNQKLQLSTTASMVFFNSVSEAYNDMVDISVGGKYKLSDPLEICFGALRTNMSYNHSLLKQDLEAVYLNAGINFKLSNIGLFLKLLIVIYYPVKKRKHTKFDIGFGYAFN